LERPDIMSLFTTHPRTWRENRYVYPVISRRSGGLSIGINLNPDQVCNFHCVYCCVDRTQPSSGGHVDLEALGSELREMLSLAQSGEVFQMEPFDQTPDDFRRLSDVAFSGDGEPTASAQFPQACRLAAKIVNGACKIVLITNATLLHQPRVAKALEFLYRHRGEVWAKLDAGTQEHFQAVARTQVQLKHVLDNILAVGRAHPIVIQTLLMQTDGRPPSPAQVESIVARLRELRDQGCRIKFVQVYTVARPSAESNVTPLDPSCLDQVSQKIQALGLEAGSFC
jgi:wyosine [tRNA(Phe)-imidazoG37] synthetase (radical SAM superfamily)